jgi:curved DNA-binding protein CbpA
VNGFSRPLFIFASRLLTRISHSSQASAEEIKHAWKKQALLHHPDRQSQPDSQKFLDIQHAYEVLKDSMLRAEYDKELLHRLYLEVSTIALSQHPPFALLLTPPNIVVSPALSNNYYFLTTA